MVGHMQTERFMTPLTPVIHVSVMTVKPYVQIILAMQRLLLKHVHTGARHTKRVKGLNLVTDVTHADV